MQNKNIALSSFSKQTSLLKKILSKNKVFTKTLKLLKESGLPNWYIGGGAIPQIVWNHYHEFNLSHGIEDFDIVYFDKSDLSKKAEQKKEKEIRKKYPDCPIKLEVVNEARTHLWYEKDFGKKIKPYSCTEEAIYSFPTTASAVGVTLNQNNKLKIFAPHGLTDLFGLVVRANKIQIPRATYEKKCRRWKKAWPKLTIIPWEY